MTVGNTQSKTVVPTNNPAPAQKADGTNTGGALHYGALFILLLQAMDIRQGTVSIQSKFIEENSNAQQKLNKENANVKFEVLPKGATKNTIQRVEQYNQWAASQRENIQNNLITERQNAQVTMTQASTNVNLLEQNASENSGWLKTLNTILNTIVKMTGR